MEKWQKEYLEKNQSKLVQVTRCNDLLLQLLLSDGVLADVDLEAIRCSLPSSGKAHVLFDILKTRTGGYAAAVKALAECKQTGALEVLAQGYAYCLSPRTPIHFLGETKQLSEYFEDAEITGIIEDAKRRLSEKLYELPIENLDVGAKEITLLRNVDPPSTSLYIPRQLFKRITLKKTLLQENCPDIFVFKGIHSLSQLTALVSQKTASSSSAQLAQGRLTSRFILLEADDDWESMLKITCVPTHLIKYEEETKTYLLESTTGGSTIIGQHLGRPQRSMEDENADKVISEDDFMDGLLTGSLSGSGVCICDSPGMGKTLLLANIACKIAKSCPDRLVAFVSLSHFIQHLTKQGIPLNVDNVYARKSILEYLSTSPLSMYILDRILTKFEVSIELFLDGFDEVNFKYIELTKKLLSEFACNFPNTRVYVTSRPNLRQDLEASLGVIAFDIAPFTEVNQKEFLVNFWKEDRQERIEERLKVFAQHCLESLRCKLTKEEENITGIPLLCRLLAQVYSRNAKIFSRSTRHEMMDIENACQFETSLPNLYTKYVDGSFEKLGNTQASTHLVNNYHIWMAMKTLFPEFQADFARQFNVATTHELVDSVMSMGILERRLIGNVATVEFVHRTFAEYFVSHFFADALKNLHYNSSIYSEEFKVQVARHLLGAMMTKDIGDADDFEGNIFINSVVVYFLNFFVYGLDFTGRIQVLADQFPTLVAPNQLYAMLFGCLRDNYGSIFKLLQNILPHLKDDVKMKYKSEMLPDGDEYFVVRLINVASVFSSIPLVDALFTLFRECFSHDLELVCKRMPLHLDTPLHFAVERADAEKIQYFANIISLKNRKLLLSSVLKSNEDGRQIVKRKAAMCKLLLSMDKELVSEAPYILYDTVHVEILKTMIEEGANPLLESSGQTVIHRAAKYMSSSHFHELCRFLIEDAKAEHLFMENVPKWKSPLPQIFQKQKNISTETCRLILGIPGVDVNEMDGKRNNLFLIAVQEKHDMELLNLLATFGADVHAVNEEGRNALHLAALTKNSDIFKFLLNLGLNHCQQDISGLTFLHIVATEEITGEEYHELIFQLSARRQADIFHLKNKEGQLPIHLAVEHVQVKEETLLIFLSHEVDLNSADIEDWSVLMYAARGKRNVQFLMTLVEMGADVTMKNEYGQTFAHLIPKKYSAEEYHELAVFLIFKGFEKAFLVEDNNGGTPLHWAALHLELLPETLKLIHSKLVIQDKLYINVTDSYGSSILMWAAWGKRSVALLVSLMDMCADVTTQNINGFTFAHLIPSHYSTEQHYQIMKLLIDMGYGPLYQKTNKFGRTPLHYAVGYLECHQPTWELIKEKLVDTGLVNINSQDIHGNPIIMSAVASNTTHGGMETDSPINKLEIQYNKNRSADEMTFLSYRSIEMFYKVDVPRAKMSNRYIKTLMKLGADPCLQNNNGQTIAHYIPFYYSAEEYHAIVEFIIDQGKQAVFAVVNKAGRTPVHNVICKVELLKKTWLLFRESLFQPQIVDMNSKDMEGNSMLQYAVGEKMGVSVFKCLFEMGANPYLQNNDGCTFAHFLPDNYSAQEYHEMVEFIISQGHQKVFAVVNKRGQTAVHSALLQMDPLNETLKVFHLSLFQTRVVDINSQDAGGNSLLMYAAIRKRQVRVINFLLEVGADPCLPNGDGDTCAHSFPLDYSAEEYHDIVQLIISKGQQKVFAVVNKKGESPLQFAVEKLELLDETLNLFRDALFQPQIVDINSKDSDGDSILMYAATGKRSVRVFKFLLEMGANPYLQNNIGSTWAHLLPLYYSPQEYHNMVEFIITQGHQKLFAVVDNVRRTPLHFALCKLELQEKTLAPFRNSLFHTKILNVNSKDSDGNSMLLYATAEKGSVGVFKFLLEMGADPFVQDSDGNTFAHLMALHRTPEEYHEIVDLIIRKDKLNLFEVQNHSGQTPLHFAVGHLEPLAETWNLLGKAFQHELMQTSGQVTSAHGLNAVDKLGNTVLHHAVKATRSLQCIKHLISLGADWSVKCFHNSSLAHVAASEGLFEHLKYFLELGCDVNAQDNDGDSVLQCAVADASENIFEMVTFLLEKGAEKHHKNKKQEQHTALAYAVDRGITDERILNVLRG